MSVSVEPWPIYSDCGTQMAWRVQMSTHRVSATLVWSMRLGRFFDSWDRMNVRRCAPNLYREAVQFMLDFCSKIGHSRSVTLAPESVTHQAGSVTEGAPESVTPSRAHGPTVFEAECHSHGRRDASSVTRDSDSAPLRSDAVTITIDAPAVRREQERRRFASDPRFAGWVAGSRG